MGEIMRRLDNMRILKMFPWAEEPQKLAFRLGLLITARTKSIFRLEDTFIVSCSP